MRRKNQKPDNCDESCFGCKNRFSCRKRVLLGYEKLAFGSTADAFRLLMCSDHSELNVDEMNLFNVSEIKKPKDGAMEIKFFDRIKALEHLGDIPDDENKAESFYNVLSSCAKELRSECDEV
ncbi:MAG: hypothetical protein II685_01795 [Clostridia bacterium]|nr:hypothetical protein [Clostridia bacterium]